MESYGPYSTRLAELWIGTVTVPVHEVTETGGPADFPAFHDLLRGVLRRGETAVIRYGLEHYGADDWHFWLDCVGDCASVEVALLAGRPPPVGGVPCLLGPRPAIRMIAAMANVPVARIHEARPVRTDFREFRQLWAGTEPDPEGFGAHRPGFVLLGRGVADMHRSGVVHGDLNAGNVFVDLEAQTVTPIDLRTAMLVCPPARPALCATDLVPLMAEFPAPVWRAFRDGYLAAWPGGCDVFELIERS